MSGSREIELKFLCAPSDLGAVLAAAPDGDDESRELISVYFDTPDLALQKAGVSLRVRESKGRRVLTMKRGVGLSREEYEAPLEGDQAPTELAPLREILTDGDAAALKPAFNVRVNRRQRLVRYGDSEIELALDQGEVTGGRRASPISEVELELKAGRPEALFELARELSRAAPLYLSFDTKSTRGQALVADQPVVARRKEKVVLGHDCSVGEAFQANARNALAHIAANAQVLREAPTPGAVHQLRVAARRLRSALATFRPVVEDAGYQSVKDELRWLAKAFDQARNLDVFAAEVLEPAQRMANPPAGLPALGEAVEAAREEARKAACETAAGERFRALMIDAVAWVETGDWTRGEAAAEPARDYAARVLAKRLRKLVKRGKSLEARDDAARHEVRIEAKKLRYAAEGFASLFSEKKADRFVGRLKTLQDDLGVLNDIATAETLLAGLDLTPEAAFAAGELEGLRMADKAKTLAAAAKALTRLAADRPFWA
ncbi:CYTH and CHAD domain-containing protein [Phenylobacterium soli]|uniref:CYTH and CHAD domain-containing protein n=1 Tax=Phenylobacterium soli TaxID=2170551 RepID=UPI0014036384|nr:CHAD domain-containing protein [Phenylobacterium soli]